MRWDRFWGIVVAVNLVGAAAVVACDTVERDAPQRYYIAPDADPVDPENPSNPGQRLDGSVATDAATDAAGGAEPSTLALTGWWRASYTASPWLGVASAGGSAGRDLADLVAAPVAGPPINGLTPAAFNGTTSKLGSTVAIATYLSPTAWEVHGLFSADAAVARTPGAAYASPALVTESINGYFYISFHNGGVSAGHYDGATFKEIVGPCPTGGLHAFQAWFDGTKLNLVIDGAAPIAPVTAGTATLGAGLLKVGANYNSAAVLNGRIIEVLTAAQVLGDAARVDVRHYFNRRYGTAFP